MTTRLSEKAKTLVDRPVLANIATVDAAGHPQLTPVWIDRRGDDLVFNTAKGRAKDANLTADPHVAVSVVDPDVVRGTVEAVEEGADEHIDRLAKKYMGVDSYPMRQPGEVRVTYVVHADKVVMQADDAS